MAQAPLVARASAFLEPSVIHKGTWGFPIIFWQRGGQSRRFEEPVGDSYLIGLPRVFARMIRPELVSRFFVIHRPEGYEDTGSSLLGRCKAGFLKLYLT